MEYAGPSVGGIGSHPKLPRMLLVSVLVTALAVTLLVALGSGSAPHAPASPAAAGAFAKLPLSFVPNRGQSASEARFTSQGPGYAFGFGRDGVSLRFSKGGRATSLRLRFVGAAPASRIEAARQLPGKVNYIGATPAASHVNLATYGELRYSDVWPGIDMYARGERGALKYEFHVSPGADPRDIGLAYAGAQALTTAADGGLRVHTELGVLRDRPPVSYQVVEGKRFPVESRFALRGDSGYGFAVGRHDPAKPLVIDPGLVYSTYLGEQTFIETTDVATDPQGNAYLTGATISSLHPTTPGAYDPSFNGSQDAFVSKLNKAGTALVYSTFIGGSSDEAGQSIAVDAAGSAYVAGWAASENFPSTPGALDIPPDSSDATSPVFVLKLGPGGAALEYVAFVGTRSVFSYGTPDLVVDAGGSAYLAGTTDGHFPTTPGAFDTSNFRRDVGLLKLDPAGSALVYGTYLGGTDSDRLGALAIDPAGNAYLTGATVSTDFPTTPGAYQPTLTSRFGSLLSDSAFVTKVNPAGSGLVYSTYLGAPPRGTVGSGIAADANGNAYVAGITRSSPFPTTGGAYDTSFNTSGPAPATNAFVTKFGPSGSLGYSTFLGTARLDSVRVGLDAANNAIVSGAVGGDPQFPITPGAVDAANPDGDDLFVSKLNATGSALSYSTYLGSTSSERIGGLSVDGDGNAVVSGLTGDDGFPKTPGAFDTTFNSYPTQSFVSKLDLLPTFFAFGNANAGGSFSPMSANTKRASPFTLFRNVTIRRVYAYVDGKGATSGQQSVRAVVYRNAGGQPAARAAQSFDFTVKAGDPGHWQPFYLAPPVTFGPGVYWLGLQSGPANGVARFAWSSKANARRFNVDTYADGPSDPFGASSADEQQLSIYAAE